MKGRDGKMEDPIGEDHGREGWENNSELGVSLGQAGILVKWKLSGIYERRSKLRFLQFGDIETSHVTRKTFSGQIRISAQQENVSPTFCTAYIMYCSKRNKFLKCLTNALTHLSPITWEYVYTSQCLRHPEPETGLPIDRDAHRDMIEKRD